MSFILDALKKSETDRQQKGAAEFANVPASSGRREGPPAWLWIVGVLLLVNLAVLIGIFLRPEVAAVEPAGIDAAAPPSQALNEFASQVATARENAPPREEPVATQEQPVQNTVAPASVEVAEQPIDTIGLPGIQQLQGGGSLALPELHVDIHVYSEVAADRFVFINMVKYKEGSQLAEGPRVEAITPDGVVLSHDGSKFLLPRD